ncbi:MAG: LruC domain-containing protein [Phocaeicola sp.]
MNKLKRAFFYIFILFVLFFWTACRDTNLFDLDRATEIYKSTFPVKDVDENQTWKTGGVVTVHLDMVEEASKNFELFFYTDNPLNIVSQARLLANTTMKGGEQALLSVDVSNAYSALYVLRKDDEGDKRVKVAAIENGELSFTWGKLSVENRNVISSFSSDSNLFRSSEEVYPTTVPEDATDFIGQQESGKRYKVGAANHDLNVWASNVTLYVVEDVDFTNLYLAANCKMYIMPGVNISYNHFYSMPTGVVVSIGKGATFTSANNTLQVSHNSSLYNRGRLQLGDLDLNGGNFVNEIEGVVQATGALTVREGEPFCNLGRLELDRVVINGGHFVHESGGVAKINQTEINTNNSSWENNGLYETNQFSASSGGLTLINRCKVLVADQFHLQGNRFQMDGGSYLNCKKLDLNNATLQMGGHAYFRVEEVAEMGYNNFIEGVGGEPTEPALFWIKKSVNIGDNFSITYRDNLLVACSDHFPKDKDPWNPYYKMEGASQLVGAENVTISIPESPCNQGINNQPAPDPEFPSEVYTYAFEDNYPQPGDYDFNDVVLDVQAPRRNGNSVEIKVTLQALGAIKHLGAGVRIVGKAKGRVLSVAYSGEDVQDFKRTWGGKNELFMDGINEKGFERDCGDDLVIPLFGDGHALFGAAGRGMINTLRIQQMDYTPKTMIIELQFSTSHDAKEFSLEDDLDFFITHNQVTTMSGSSYYHNPRVEVHLFGHRDSPTYRGTTFDYIKQVAGKVTWGISAPSFRYPLELVSITEAYPLFAKWAQNMNTNKDWYNYPTTNKTWR